jgi:hypothetical protein
MRTFRYALMSAAVAFPAMAQDLPTMNLAPYLVGVAPAGLEGPTPPATPAEKPAKAMAEKASAVNGTLYAVIAPTYYNPADANATQSFIRLFNGAAGPSNFSIRVVGSPTAREYGTANIQVPRTGSPQYSMAQILQNANAGALTGGDTTYSLYIQNPDTMSGFQHVIFNNATRFFENVSVCNSLLNQTLATNTSSAVLTNVHTSRMTGYPSQIELHNYWNAAVTYRLTMIDSVAGAALNNPSINVVAQPNATYRIPMTDIEAQLNWTPGANQFHVNLVVTDTSGGPPYNMLGQSIVNQTLGANISMSTTCAVNNPSSSTYSGGPGLNGY